MGTTLASRCHAIILLTGRALPGVPVPPTPYMPSYISVKYIHPSQPRVCMRGMVGWRLGICTPCLDANANTNVNNTSVLL